MEYQPAPSNMVGGISYKDAVETTYEHIHSILGDPHERDIDGKVQASWCLLFDDDVVATIYDWKQYRPVESVKTWHIGGFDNRAVSHMKEVLGL